MSQVTRRRESDDVLVDSDQTMALAGVTAQRVQTQYTTAMQVQERRALPMVEKRALAESAMLGEDAFYAWGAGKNRIEGPSKDLAMALVRCYGNCAVDLGDVQETRDAWIFRATFVDLETGFTLARQFRQSKTWAIYGQFDEARKDDIRFQIGQSKAVRNVILNALPGWLVRRALDRAKGGVREKIEAAIKSHTLPVVAAKAMERLANCKATEANVLLAMGRANVASLTIEDLVILAGSVAALEAGQDTVENLFPAPEKPTEAGGSKTESLVDRLTPKTDEPPTGSAGDVFGSEMAEQLTKKKK